MMCSVTSGGFSGCDSFPDLLTGSASATGAAAESMSSLSPGLPASLAFGIAANACAASPGGFPAEVAFCVAALAGRAVLGCDDCLCALLALSALAFGLEGGADRALGCFSTLGRLVARPRVCMPSDEAAAKLAVTPAAAAPPSASGELLSPLLFLTERGLFGIAGADWFATL